MPYIPYSLDELLQSSRFSPHPIISFGTTTSPSSTPREVEFVVLSKSIVFQVLCGVSYLHSELQIAHRDIKPSNVLLTPSGCAQLIDFGIAFRVGEDRAAKARDLWPESAARMYFEVSTGYVTFPCRYDLYASWMLTPSLCVAHIVPQSCYSVLGHTMPLPSTHGASASRLPNSSPLSVYKPTRMTRTSTARPNLNPGPTRASNHALPPRPRCRSSYPGEHTYRQAVGRERLSSTGRVARSGSLGVSSRYGVPPTRIHGRYVIPFLARSSSLALDAHP